MLYWTRTPSLRKLLSRRCKSGYETRNRGATHQLAARLPGVQDVIEKISGNVPALPLDNKLKDFLVSAERKFSSFGQGENPTYGLLVVCWTERMFEAVSPLSNEGCGLLTPESFYEVDGEKVRFPFATKIAFAKTGGTGGSPASQTLGAFSNVRT